LTPENLNTKLSSLQTWPGSCVEKKLPVRNRTPIIWSSSPYP